MQEEIRNKAGKWIKLRFVKFERFTNHFNIELNPSFVGFINFVELLAVGSPELAAKHNILYKINTSTACEVVIYANE